MYDGFISYSHAADDLLAPRLQSALQRFAKPWWKRRAVRIFRDESSLSANPHLWSSITEALDTSGWFVLLLSPDAARSEWVNQEIGYWVEHRDPKKILPVVTDGTFGWADDVMTGSAVPEALQGVFTEEPRWVDMRWAKGEEQLDLQNPVFADAIADIASAIREVPKDELSSEEVRQHRRTVRTAWAAGIVTAAFAVAAVGFGLSSARNADEAERQALIAQDNATEAQRLAESEAAARTTAEENAREAERAAEAEAAARAAADTNAAIAKIRELSAASIGLLDSDPELAVLLGLEAIRSAPDSDSPPPAARIALRQAVQSSFLLARYPIELVDGEIFFGELAPNGDAVVLGETHSVHVVDLSDGSTRWTTSVTELATPEGATGLTCAGEVYFSADGTKVLVGLVDASTGLCGIEVPDQHLPRSGIAVFDASTGERLAVEWLSECGDQILGAMSPVDPIIPVVTPADGECDPGSPPDWTITMLDAETLELVRAIPVPDIGMTTWSADGRRISIGAFFGWGAVVYDAATGDTIAEVPDGGFLGFLSPDGTMIATSDLASTVSVFDADTGLVLDRLPDLGDSSVHVGWSADSRRIYAVSRGPRTAVWDASSGAVEVLMPNTGPGAMVLFDDASQRLIHVGADSVSIWDVSGAVEGARNTAQVDARVIQAHSVSGISGAASVGAFLFVSDDWNIGTFDTSSGVLGDASRSTAMGRRTAVLDDGRILNFERNGRDEDMIAGPLVAWDPITDEVTEVWGCSARLSELDRLDIGTGFFGPCPDGSGDFFDVDRALLSADRTTLAVNSFDGQLLFFDPQTLELLESTSLPEGAATIREVGEDWLATRNFPTGVTTAAEAISLYSLPDMELLATLPGSYAQSSPTGDLVAINEGPGHVSILDTATGQKVMELRGGSARIRGLAFSPDGSLLMTSATDGFMRIWELSTGIEIERIPLGDSLEGSGDGYWIDEDTVALALGRGRWTNIDIGLGSLLDLARSRILRGLTQTECDEYRIDPCPTLDEMRGG